MDYVSTKLLLEKSAETKKNKYKKKQWKCVQSLADSGDTSSSGRFLRRHFQNSSP